MRAKLARPAQFERQMASADDGDPLLAGPLLDKTAQGATQFHKASGLWHRWSKDICVDGNNGQIGLGARRDDWTCNTMINTQFITECEIKSSIQSGPQ